MELTGRNKIYHCRLLRRHVYWIVDLAILLSLLVTSQPAKSDQIDMLATSIVVEVDKTTLRIFKNGRELPQSKIIGAKLTVKDTNGIRLVVRIDEEMLDPADAAGEIHLYKLSVQDTQTGEWQNMCHPGPDGLALSFPVQGTWTSDGRHLQDKSFSVTCTGGAIGKCIRYGYKPWKTGLNGKSLWDYHQACVRMVRADYCGDGTSWTRDGMQIDLYDQIGIQEPDRRQNMQFEAAWGTNGAICVNHPRVPERITLSALLKRCPERLRLTSASCTASATAHRDDVLISNESFAN